MGLLPGHYNFKIWKGAVLSKQFSLRDRTGQSVDLTGLGVEFRLPGLVLDLNSGLEVVDPGVVELTLTSDQTRAITWKRANYELVVLAEEDYPMLTGQVIALGI